MAGVRNTQNVRAPRHPRRKRRAAARHYDRIVGRRGPPFLGIAGDLWDGVQIEGQFDVVTFNPPLIDIRLSDDPYIVRNRCMGPGLAQRGFDQLRTRSLWRREELVYLAVSNTSPLRDVVAMVTSCGLRRGGAGCPAVADQCATKRCPLRAARHSATQIKVHR